MFRIVQWQTLPLQRDFEQKNIQKFEFYHLIAKRLHYGLKYIIRSPKKQHQTSFFTGLYLVIAH